MANKRSRRDGPYERDFHDGPFVGRGSPDYDRRPPSPKGNFDDREFERRPSVGRERPEDEKRPMTFKEFTLRKVPDDAAPEAAQRMFQEYLVEYYGSAIKAEFEQNMHASHNTAPRTLRLGRVNTDSPPSQPPPTANRSDTTARQRSDPYRPDRVRDH
ncbi:hypothetical protein TSOC_005447 [Tetrabaena socialis]|uniref:SERRATE/Ars2 N-terminal domain-containing protein n=1 Tax=Tetrabaena socialis TaxID=47790 RepID=A0A2J8A6C2_9CHLO|nr:hypothetical protein TSOC_005447 [Tetrabaena socialis]|eukprot:PNH08047.1 hypothetical protein TSOC_005447 [Tetrabaena socialis]